MRTAITPKYLKYLFFLAITVMVTALTGCTLDGISDVNQQEEITQADLEAASKILGESLSDENDGVMASLNDALTGVSETGFGGGETFFKQKSGDPTLQTHDDDSNSGRGEERNFSYHYDPATGTHTITFHRVVHDGDYYKSVTDTLLYIFTDANGEFVDRPREEKELIETIDYKGDREGQIHSPEKESFFSRQDTFFIDGVSEASTILAIDGVHHGDGRLSTTDDEGNDISRTYTTVINFLDIQIDKEIVAENGSLEQGVTGTLSWEMVITNTTNGESRTKTIRGTVEMNGDGTALLRFDGFVKRFLINLDDGHVRDHDDEFEGRIKHVNIEERTFTLGSGRIVQLTDDTRIDPEGDVTTLEGVVRALEEGHFVEAEGHGSAEGDIFVASSVQFEVDDPAEEHFEGLVTKVNFDTHSITVGGELTVRFGEESVISENGDLHSLEGVAEALELNKDVKVKGAGIPDAETDADLLALEVKFLVQDPDLKAFEGEVTGVFLDAGVFTLNNEHNIKIADRTTISSSGDLHTLIGIAEAIENGYKVVAFGKGEVTDNADYSLIALEVKFIISEPEPTIFEDQITAVDLDARSFTLGGEQVIRMGEDTDISDSGELFSLEEVAESLEQQNIVVGRGEGIVDNHTNADLIALEVRFDIEN